MKACDARERGGRMLRDSGYGRASGGGIDSDEASDAKMVKSGVGQHESALHKGSPKTKLKLRSGGKVEGKEAAERPDRRARGGHIGKHKGKVIVNINAAGGQDDAKAQMAHQQGMQQGAAIGARMAAAKMGGAGGPPPPGAGPMAPPPGAGAAGPMPPPGPPGAGPGGPPMPPRPMGPPPGGLPPGAGPGGPPMPMRASGGALPMYRRGAGGRFTGGAV